MGWEEYFKADHYIGAIAKPSRIKASSPYSKRPTYSPIFPLSLFGDFNDEPYKLKKWQFFTFSSDSGNEFYYLIDIDRYFYHTEKEICRYA